MGHDWHLISSYLVRNHAVEAYVTLNQSKTITDDEFEYRMAA